MISFLLLCQENLNYGTVAVVQTEICENPGDSRCKLLPLAEIVAALGSVTGKTSQFSNSELPE